MDQSFTVGKLDQAALTVTAPSAGTYGTFYDLAASGGSGTGAVTWEVASGTACAIVSGGLHEGQLQITAGTGTCTVRVTRAADATYNEASATGVVAIGKADQAITFGPLGDKAVGDPPFTVSATTTSPLAVSFAAAGACTVEGDLVTLTGAGSCTITASQAGDDNWNAAAPVDQSFTVGKLDQAALTVTAPSAGTYGTFYDLAASGGSGTGAVTWEVASGTACAIVSGGLHEGQLQITAGTGTCTVRVTRAADATYNEASATGVVAIAKADQAITFGPLGDKAVGDPPFTVSATTTSPLAVTFAAAGACTVEGDLVTLTGAGSCTITASQAGDANWNAAAPVDQSFTVTPASYTLSGTVTGTAGAALPGAYVVVYQAASPTWVTTLVADGTGHYGASLPGGTYRVRIQPNTTGYPNFWYGGTSYAGATDIALSADKVQDFSATALYSLSGRVTGTAGAALPGAYVVVYQAASPTWVTTLVADGTGHYGASLPGGTYRVRIQPNTTGYPNFWYGGTSYAGATDIALSADKVQDFSATALYSLSGRVTGTAGAALPGAYVVVYQAASPTWVTTLVADGTGHYGASLPGGTYRVRIQPNTTGYPNFWYGGTSYAGATDIALSADKVQDFSATALYSLSGTVTGTAGAALPGAYVVVYQAASPTWVTTLVADGTGHYGASLPGGTYRVRIQPNTTGYPNFWYGGTSYAGATDIALSADKVQDFSLAGL